MNLPGYLRKISLAAAVILFLPSCTFLSNRAYVEHYPEYQGVRRIAIFLQRWPCYLQLPEQSAPGEGFINKRTLFPGLWKPGGNINPRAVDVQEIDDELVGELLLGVLISKGYQPFLAKAYPRSHPALTVSEIMANYQVLDREVDAFLFCYYSPTLFFSREQAVPSDHGKRAYSLQEVIAILRPGSDGVIWAGPRAHLAPADSISHAFIYLSMTLFKAWDWRVLWQAADSQVGGRLRPILTQCAPGPTNLNYWADAAIIQRLMMENLRCQMRHLIPDAF